MKSHEPCPCPECEKRPGIRVNLHGQWAATCHGNRGTDFHFFEVTEVSEERVIALWNKVFDKGTGNEDAGT
jgi:hypothetical protein